MLETLDFQTLTPRVISFTKESLQWCIRQSEDATVGIIRVLDALLADAERVSHLSAEALLALQSLREPSSGNSGIASHSSYITALEKMVDGESRVNSFIFPLIQALQFQDRIRQNMENIQKMISCWQQLTEQESISQKQEPIQTQLLAFGQTLLQQTTMQEERTIIRAIIPGLPNDEVDDTTQFFD